MRYFKSIFIGLTLALFILLSAAVTVSIFYEDEVSQFLVEELNEYILSEIKVEDVKFSILKKFPKASLEFKNVIAFTKKGYYKNIDGFNTDTLFFAKSIFVEFNLFEILSKQYHISSIHFDKGKINLFVDRLGDPNYIFWDNSNKESTGDFNLELNEVKITNSRLLFCNDATKLVLQSFIYKVDFEGNFSNQNYLMKIKSDQLINELKIEEIKYLNHQKVKANLNLDIINDLIRIKEGHLNLENLKFDVNGNINRSNNPFVDFLISGKDLNLRSVTENLPQSIRDEFPAIITQKGEITLNLNIAGENLKTDRPHVEAMFLIHNAQFFDENKQIRLSNIFIDGEFSNGDNNNAESSKITFKSFKTNIESNQFEGSVTLKNLSDPILNFDVKSILFLDEIKDLFNLDTLDILKGNVDAQINYNGTYADLRAFKFPDLFTKDYKIQLQLKSGEMKLKNHPLLLSEISGKFDVRNSLLADSLYFKINENDFLINGRISKLFEYFSDKEMFNVNAEVFSRKINLDDLAPLFRTNTENSSTESSYQFPDKLALQLRLNIQNFEVGKFNATNIMGNLNYKPRMFSLHEISFNSMNGKVKAGGVIIQKFNNDFVVKSQSRLSNININQLFYSFNNFGQEFITNKHLEGDLTGDVYLNSEWSDRIKIYKNTVSADCDITIQNGELNNFEPLLGLSRFIEVEELKKIKFSTLKNKITIQNEKIIIPQMDIESSAINITASGEHNFDNSYSYHLKLLLSDLLSKKVRKSKQRSQDPENVEEDNQGRITLFLLLEGDTKGSKVRYDRKAAREVRKENLNAERNDLRRILNEELGWFKSDSILNKNSNSKKEPDNFQIEFEESKPDSKKTKPIEPVSNQKFKIEWEEDTVSKK